MGFFTRLEEHVRQLDSLLCVGLDPHQADLQAPTADAARDFCLRLIDATADVAAAFKPNSAFFEVFGAQGFEVLAEVIAAVPSGIPVILDVKRGDIATTAQAYAQAAYQTFGADAVTLNPYLGYDSLEPFLEDPQRGVFLLCRTSNPGSSDLQELLVSSPSGGNQRGEGLVDSCALFERIAFLAQSWNARDNLGLVVGATFPLAIKRVRDLAPQLWILSPGVGAQGGDLESTLAAGLRSDGLGMLLAVSRALSLASSPKRKSREIRDTINRLRAKVAQPSARMRLSKADIGQISEPVVSQEGVSPELSWLADGLLEVGCVKFGEFTLKSGLQSPIYLDLRQLVGYPSLLTQVAKAYIPLLSRLSFDRLAALPYAGLPIATAISMLGGWPLIYPRKEAKAYGMRAEIEGLYQAGERVVVIDDLATTGESKFEVIEKLTSAGLQITDVVVLVDRQSGALEALARKGYRLHSVFTLVQLVNHWGQTGKVSPDQVQTVLNFLAAH